MIVKLSTPFDPVSLLAQTPARSGVWDGFEFITDPLCRHADAWVVYEGLKTAETTVCPPSRTILFTGEPPAIKSYPERFASQFARVVTSHTMRHPGLCMRHQSYPWHYGREFDDKGHSRLVEDYDSLTGTPPFERKERLLSIVCSTKRKRDGHRIRNEFVSFLERNPIPGMEIFGAGRERQIPCKRDAIAPYRYHIAIENSQLLHYWTEKLADSYLGGALPFYWGCPNLEEYFPAGSFVPIDIERPEEALRTILDTIGNDTYERSVPMLREARELILNRYNLFPSVVSMLEEMPHSSAVSVTIRPEEAFTLRGRTRQARLGVKAWYRRIRGLGPYA